MSITNYSNNTNCDNIKENLSAYIDEMLDAEQSHTINEHLQSCEDCKKEFDSLSEIVSLLLETQIASVPDAFDVKFQKALRIEKNKRAFQFKRKVAMISSVCAVFVIGIFAITMYNHISDVHMHDANYDVNDFAGTALAQPIMMHDAARGIIGNDALPGDNIRLYDADAEVTLYYGNFSTVNPFVWGFGTPPIFTPPIGEREMPYEYGSFYRRFTHERIIPRGSRDLSLVWVFLYEQYHIEGSNVNINWLDADGTNISSRFVALADANIFMIELITEDFTEVHTLIVTSKGEVSLQNTEVFDYARPLMPEVILGDDREPARILYDIEIDEPKQYEILRSIRNYPD